MEFQPFYDRVLVRPEVEEANKKTDSGLYIVKSKDNKEEVRFGSVLASGEGRLSPEGVLVKNSTKKGDRVMFRIQDAIVYKADDKENTLIILRDTDIIAVVTD